MKRTALHEIQLLKKFSIPEFSGLKWASTPDSPSYRKGASQELSSTKKAPTTPEPSGTKKLTTPEFPTPNKTLTPESPQDKKITPDQIDEIPSFGSGSKLSRSISSSSYTGDKGKPPLPKYVTKLNNQSEKGHYSAEHHHFSHVSEHSPLLSAPADVDQKKRQFSFTPDDQKTIIEETRKSSVDKGSGSSSCQSETSVIEIPVQPLTYHMMQSQTQLYTHHDRPSHDYLSNLQRSLSPKRTISGIESLPQQDVISGSPPTDGMDDPASAKGDHLRRKPPNKFLKRAQSFSQFLKKKPAFPERRKKSGDGSRDDYYLPISVEQLEEPQGEMMLVPVEMLVSMADLTGRND